MFEQAFRRSVFSAYAFFFLIGLAASARAQTPAPASPAPPPSTPAQPAAAPQQPSPTPSRADILRGSYGQYRANNDLLYYHLDVRVDPDKKTIAG
jgi:hypothetical protein